VSGDEPFWVRASTSTLSYPAPLWQTNLSDFGRRAISSLSKGPVSCTQCLSSLFSNTSIVDVLMWSCSTGRGPRHHRILRFVVSAGSLSCCRFHIPDVGQLRYLGSTQPSIHTFKVYFEEYSFHSLFVWVSPPISKTVFFDIAVMLVT
jgi:hypothetical protein